MDDYLVLGRIGEGAHGIVMKGRHKSSGQVVALKKVLLKRLEDGIPETALREIKALQVPFNNGGYPLIFEGKGQNLGVPVRKKGGAGWWGRRERTQKLLNRHLNDRKISQIAKFYELFYLMCYLYLHKATK